jgi:hypothetical protein
MTGQLKSRPQPEQIWPPLVDILLASLTALAMAGRIETACRLAGQACAASRTSSPAAWQAFNAFLHRFAPHTPDL